jgi:hypothetical protein
VDISLPNDLPFRLGQLTQIGVVVRSVDHTAEFYSSCFGIGPWTIYDFVCEKSSYRGKAMPLHERLGKAMLGNVELELLEPLEGSICREQLDATGEGLNHLGFLVADYDQVYRQFIGEGLAPLQEFEAYVPTYKGQVRGAFFDSKPVGGVMIEIFWKSWLVK